MKIFFIFKKIPLTHLKKIKFYEGQNWQIIISANYILIAHIIINPVPKIQTALKID